MLCLVHAKLDSYREMVYNVSIVFVVSIRSRTGEVRAMANNNGSGDPIAVVVQAMQYLAGVCDGAITRDGHGFNGRDTRFGHSVAQQSLERDLSPKQVWASWRLLQKYADTQLYDVGIELPHKQEVESALAAREAADAARLQNIPKGWITYDPELDKIAVKFNFRQRGETDGVPFNKGWIEAIKQINKRGRRFDRETSCWYIDSVYAAELIRLLPILEVSDEVRVLVQAAEAAEVAEAEFDYIFFEKCMSELPDLTQPLFGSDIVLYEHQREGVEFLLRRRFAILGDGMGLGKTFQALVAAYAVQQAFEAKVILVVPAYLRHNWHNAVRRLGLSSRLDYDVFSWRKQPDPLEIDGPYVLIGDEAHYAQSWRSARSRAFRKLAKHPNCLACWPMSGTPMKNGLPNNIGPLLDAIHHPLVDDIYRFQYYYCYERNRFAPRGWSPTGALHLDELHERIKDNLLIRSKADCLDLPPLTRVLERVTPSAVAIRLYNETVARLRVEHEERVRESIRQRIEEGMDPAEAARRSEMAEAIVTLNRLRHAGEVAKSEAAVEIAMQVLDQGDQVVLFVNYKDTAGHIVSAIRGAGYTAEALTGDVVDTPTNPARDDMWRKRFLESGEIRALVCTFAAGGVGIDLYSANVVILVSRAWTPGDNRQAEDRLHRIGQEGNVTSIWLQLNGGSDIDQKIDQLILKKAERIGLVLRGKRKTMRGVGGLQDIADQILGTVFEGWGSNG